MPKGRMVSLAIGVADPGNLPYLAGARNSAAHFHQWAQAVGYESTLLTDADSAVTVETLRVELDKLLKGGLIHRLVVYFAGHGLIRAAEESLWLLSKWDSELRAVAVEPFKRRLYRYSVSQVAIFADCCRSLPDKMENADLTPDAVLGKGPRSPNNPPIDRYTAAQDGAETFMVPGNSEDEDRCLFSGVLMEGLWGANGLAFSTLLRDSVTSRSLASFLEKEVPRRAATYKRKLAPSVTPTFPEDDDIYFHANGSVAQPALPAWPEVISGVAKSQGTRTKRMVGAAKPAGPSKPPKADANLIGFYVVAEDKSQSRIRRNTSRAARSQPNLAELLRTQHRPDRFETEAGFVVDGGNVKKVWIGKQNFVETHREKNWWRIGALDGYQLKHAAPVLIEFDDRTFGTLAALPRFITSLLKDQSGIRGMVYRGIYSKPNAETAAEEAVAALEGGKLRARDATNIAADIRRMKHADPVLGVISAYLYDAIGDFDSIRRMAYFYIQHNQPIPFDIALLGQLKATRGKDGVLTVLVPAVKARKPRTTKEKPLEWTFAATPQAKGTVGGLWPWLRQGWTYLDEWDDFGGALVLPELVELRGHLLNSRFTTLDAEGGKKVAKLANLYAKWLAK